MAASWKLALATVTSAIVAACTIPATSTNSQGTPGVTTNEATNAIDNTTTTNTPG